MQESIFTKIINGDIPCHKIYEDARTFAFLDIEPLLPGHVLIVPKEQVDHIDDLPADDYQALFRTVKKVSKHVKAVFGKKRAITYVLGFDVPHAHVHVMPADSSNEFFQAVADHLKDESVSHQSSQSELAEIAAKLRMEDEL